MWGTPLILDKYAYAYTNRYYVRLLGILGIFTSILMGYGLWLFLQLNFLYILIFGPIVAIFLVNKLMRFTIQLFFQQFNIRKHEKFLREFWAVNPEPAVDIFLPWAGEDLSIHEEVVKGVSLLDYKNKNVFMLDDIGSEEHKKLAQKYGFTYLSRPNKGQYKKSGNLQYGYDHSQGEFVFILDADFIPIKEALRETVPYLVRDEKIGILQTPQYFEQTKNVHKRSKIEFGGGNIVEDFYRIVMPSRDEFGAAMCVGTSAIYRRKTIRCLNSTPKVHASEDLATGLLITKFGYRVKYLPLIISMGTSPASYQGYFKQHMRWCSGNLVFARYWPKAQLSVVARIIYMTNPLYYLSEALTIVFSFQFLVLLYFHADSLSIANSLYFLPYIFLSRILIPLAKTKRNRVGTKLAALSNSYTYFYTYIRMLTKGLPTWHPTGVKLQSLHSDFLEAYNVGTGISLLFVASFLFVLISRYEILGNFNTYIILAWTFYSVFWHVLFLTFVLRYIYVHKRDSIANSFGKVLLFAKTYSIAALFGAILLTASVGSFFASLDADSETVVALSKLWNKPTSTALLATSYIKTPIPAPEEEILGVSTSGRMPAVFTTQVSQGQTLSTITQELVSSYSGALKVELSNKQMTYATYHIVERIGRERKVVPGEVIKFDELMLLNAIERAVEKDPQS